MNTIDKLLSKLEYVANTNRIYCTDNDPDYRAARAAVDAEIKRMNADYLKLASWIAPDADEEFLMSHSPEQIIDIGLQRTTLKAR